MDRSEPALIPEWLKSSGSVTSGGYGNHQSASCLHSDDHSVSKHARNKSSVNSSESFQSDRTTSSYFRRSTSSKDSSHSRSYSSFNRSHRDKVWEDFPEFSDKDKFILTEHKRHHEYSDNLGGALSGKFSKENLRRSQSMVSRKLDANSSRKVTRDSSDSIKSSPINNSNLLLASGSVQSSMQTAFGRDFPSLGTEPKLGASELRRVPSPVLGPTVQSFPPASANVVGVDGWTSSLAEVPGLIANSSASSLLSQQAASGSSSPLSQRAGGLNMAEAVAQGPSRARTPPQASLDTQRLEELAIKQSRQLIPVIPSITKPAALGPLEKLKHKSGQQQQQSPQILSMNHGNQSVRSGPAKLDTGKTTNLGKLQVLKPSREVLNGIPSSTKETVSPKNGVKVVVDSPLSQTPSTAAPNKSPVKTQHLLVQESKAATLLTSLEKKPSQQVQSRIDFFKLLKKKSTATNPPPRGVGAGAGSSASEKSNGEVTLSSNLDASVENGSKVMNNGREGSKENHVIGENGEEEEEEHSDVAVPDPDEEEAAFLRSLGWEECAGEDGLTEEEIKAFYELMKERPASSGATAGVEIRVNNGSCAASTTSASSVSGSS